MRRTPRSVACGRRRATVGHSEPVPSEQRPPLSVVIPTRDRPEHLRRCLAALRAELTGDDEVVVVDSASTEPAVRQVAAEASATVVVAERPGASLARNLGWDAARHDLVAFLDDDVEVLTGWRNAVVGALSRERTAFMTGWIGVAPEQQHLPEPNPIMLRPEPRRLDAETDGAFGATANCAVKRAALAAVGGFSESFGPGTRLRAAEDQELFDRLVATGHVGWYEPAAAVHHDQWRTRGDAVRLHWSYGVGQGARLRQLRRLDRTRFRRVLREVCWDDGLCSIGRALRGRYRMGVVFATLRLAGTLVGFMLRQEQGRR